MYGMIAKTAEVGNLIGKNGVGIRSCRREKLAVRPARVKIDEAFE